MNLSQLPQLLTRIAEIFERSGARRQAEGIRSLKDVLSEEIASSGDAAFSTIRSRLTTNARPRKKNSVRQVKVSAEEFVARLESATEDASFREMLRETAIFGKADLDKIAHLYAKGPRKYKNKAEAIQDIERRFVQKVRARTELEYLEKKKVTPW